MRPQTLIQLEPLADGPLSFVLAEARYEDDLYDVLFEQLDYLIQFADEEPGRFARVKSILMEPFQ